MNDARSPRGTCAQAVAVLLLVPALSPPPASAQTPPMRRAITGAAVASAAVGVSATQTEREQAESIARDSPDPREAARRLRRSGAAALPALRALREVHGGSDRGHWRALLDAQYTRPELAEALRRLDLLDAAAFDRRMDDFGETPELRAQLLLRLYPGFDFGRLFAHLQGTRTLTLTNYAAAMAALAPPPSEIAAIAVRDHRARRFPAGGGRFFPEPQDAHALIRASHPGASHTAIWAALLAAGYEPALVFKRLPVGEIARDGRPLDAVAGCIAQAFSGRSHDGNPVVPIGGSESVTARLECYRRFAAQLREHRVARAQAAAVLGLVPRCVAETDPSCPRQREAIVASWLASAGYSGDPR